MSISKVAIGAAKLRMTIVSIFLSVVGCMLWFPALMYLVDEEFRSEQHEGIFVLLLILCAIGAWLLVLTSKLGSLCNKVDRYVSVISNTPNGSIPHIAVVLGEPEDKVRENLEKMIEQKLLPNAYIDQRTNCIIFGNNRPLTDVFTAIPGFAERTGTMVTVKCNGCGGINTVRRGAVKECDFCGSSIRGA